jgi:hypothetical protein
MYRVRGFAHRHSLDFSFNASRELQLVNDQADGSDDMLLIKCIIDDYKVCYLLI